MNEKLARVFRLFNDPLNFLAKLLEVLLVKPAQMITHKTVRFRGCNLQAFMKILKQFKRLHTIVEAESDEVYNSLMSDHLS